MSTSLYDTSDLTIGRLLALQTERRGAKPFIRSVEDGRSLTFADVETRTTRLANRMLAIGIGRGTHAAIMMENSVEFLLVYFALGKLGAVAVPINTAARGKLLRYYLEQSDSSVLLVDDALYDRVLEAELDPKAIQSVILMSPAAGPQRREILGARTYRYSDDLTGGSDEPIAAPPGCHDPALMAYTSGTTGPSKGNMLCQAAAICFGLSNVDHHGYRSDDHFYICLPLFHLGALGQMFAALTAGSTLTLARRFSVSGFWSDVRSSGSTVTTLIGSMSHFIWNQPHDARDCDNPLRMVMMAPVSKFAIPFQDRFGLKIGSNYGLSDYALAAGYRISDPVDKLGSAGCVRRNMEMAIADDNDVLLPAGEVGEIVIRCKEPWRAASGYYKMPEATLKAWRNFWYHTGDRGFLDEDGFLFFVDRKKDAIRRRGENISAHEVEMIAAGHPAVAEAAAFPVKSEMSEDEVGLAVIAKAGAVVNEADLIAYCQRNMAYFMVPRFVQVRDDFPRALNHKVEKYKIRTEVEATLPAVWDREKAGIVVTR
ncbi:MAG: AMP-binding protein [Reyranella sp.]